MKRAITSLAFLIALAASSTAFAQDDAAPVAAEVDAAATVAAPVTIDAGAIAAATETASDPNALTQVTSLAFQILEPILMLLISWLIVKALGFLKKKTGIELPAAIENQMDKWVEQGIHLAVEKSHQKVKEKTAKLTGPEKLETAAGFVLSMAESQGWTQWGKDKIKEKIEAKLGVDRS